VVFRKSEGKWSVRFKQYLKDDSGKIRKGKPISILDGPFNQEGTWEIERIFGTKDAFQNPKPSELVRRLFSYELNGDQATDSIYLDSTAGSGTTGHAILQLNREDGGNRRFVLIQQPFDTKENEKDKLNICRRITRERVKRVIDGYTYSSAKKKNIKELGLGGSFSYVSVGSPLLGEYRDLGTKLPAYDEIAKYIFYTETSRDFDKSTVNQSTGKIGEHRKTSYYLLYTPNNEHDHALDLQWLKSIEKSEKNRNVVVYCEKIWIHRDDLAKYEKDTGRKVRPMLIPFNLK
jgi:adenine-specific DNA-methyltransferase